MAKENKFVFDSSFKQTQEEVIRNLKISNELKSLIPPLTKEEYELLESSVLTEGCREDLIVWKKGNEFVLVDGHNRYSICQKHDISFNTQTKDFTDIEEVKDWMINNQLGKRNVTEEVKSYLRGLQYKNEKKITPNIQNLKQNTEGDKLSPSIKTRDKLAEQHKVSAKTIERDEKYALALDYLVGDDTDLKWKILNREIVISKTDLEKIAKETPEQIQRIKNELETTGKINLSKTLITEKEKKITSLFNYFLKTRDIKVIDEIYEMMKNMA